MHIAFDVGPLRPPRTGIGHYVASLLERLLEYPEVELIPFSFSVERSSLEDLLPEKIRSAGDGSQAANRRRRSLRMARLLPRRLRLDLMTLWTITGKPSAQRLIDDARVVHGTNFWIPPIPARKGIVTIHDMTFWLYPEMCPASVRRFRLLVPRVLKRCALVITPSETVGEQVAAELGFSKDRIVVTPEGVRGVFIGRSPDPALEKRLGVSGSYLLFAGTQEPRKNLDRLIASLRLLDDLDITLVIAGPEGWGSVDLPAVVRKLRLEGRVIFAGYLPEQELGALVAGATAFVYPSIYEGFGLPPLEAMAAGVPVVAARAGSLPEVLDDAPVWCDPLDIGSIADGIRTLLTDEAERERAVRRGREVVARYDWDQTAARTVAAYKVVAEQA